MSHRVLQVIRTAGVSGAEHHLETLVAALPATGWISDVLLAAPDPEVLEPFASRLAGVGGEVTLIPMRRDISLRMCRHLRRALRGGAYDLVHTHLVHADWHAGLASIGMRSPKLISTKHNHDPFRTRQPFKWAEGRWLKRCAEAIAISESLSDFVARHHGVTPTTVLYGWPAGPERALAGTRLRRLIAVGRLEPQKGFDVLMTAIGLLRDAGVDVCLDIAGEGGQRSALERHIQSLDLSEHVRLLGQRSDVPDLMMGADLFVHSARWEGFGLVLLEAMNATLPIVATAVGAIPEVVAADETALLVPPNDAEALAAAVTRLVAYPELARSLALAGHRRLRKRFAPETMAQRTAEVYERAMTSRAHP